MVFLSTVLLIVALGDQISRIVTTQLQLLWNCCDTEKGDFLGTI